MRKVLRWPHLEFRKEYFLFLLPLFFIFHGYNEYYGKIPVRAALWLLVQYEVMLVVMALVFFLLFRSFRKAALFSFLLGCYYFFYGAGHDWLKEVLPGTLVVKYSFILPATLLAFAGLFLYLKKARWSFERGVAYLNLLFLCLLGIEVIKVFNQQLPHQDIVKAATVDNKVAPLLKPCDTCDREDIHLIVLDEYAGATPLKEVFRFDNTPFADSLRARGFRVIEGASSNYNYTSISIASMLSLDYLPGLGKWPAYELIDVGNAIVEQNVFVDYLISQGYEINNVSVFDLKELPPYKSEFKSGISLITDHSFPRRLQKDIGYHLITTFKSEIALRDLVRGLEKEVAENGHRMDTLLNRVKNKRSTRPQFYYTHLMMPHQPFVLDRNGKSVGFSYYLDPDRDRGFKRGYLENLQYCNKRVVAFVDSLVRVSPRPPVIILMGDHGFRHPSIAPKYQFMTINAVLFPDRRYEGYYDGQSIVNQMRVLLNNRFGQKLSLLKDSTVFLGWEGM